MPTQRLLLDLRFVPVLPAVLALAAGVWGSTGPAGGQAAPLAGLFQPPPETVATTLFCPDCLLRPFLFEAHLEGTPIAVRDAGGGAGVPAASDVDVDLLVFRPGTTRVSSWRPDCARPPAGVVSNEMQGCYAEDAFAQAEISPRSTGWYDHFSQPSGFYQRESFYVGNRADAGLEAGATWCLLPYVQQAPRGGLVATLEIGIAFGAGPLRACTTDVAIEAAGLKHAEVIAEGCTGDSRRAPRRPPPLRVEWLAGGTACLHVPASWTCHPETPRCDE